MTDVKILLVEDEAHWQKILREDIQKAVSQLDQDNIFPHITIKETVDEGKKVLEPENSWSLMVTDLVLPSPSGMREMKLVERARQLGIPTIVISEVETSKDFWNQLFENEVDDFFSKATYYTRINGFIHRIKQILTAKGNRVLIEDVQVKDILTKKQRERNEFQEIWNKAKSALEHKQSEIFQAETDKLTTLLCQKLSFRPLEDTATLFQLYGRMIDTSTSMFKLNIRRQFPLIYACDKNCDKDDIDKIIGILKNFKIVAKYFALLVTFSDEENLQQWLHESAYKNDFIVLNQDKLWDIISASYPLEQLTKYILKQIDLVIVSPYTFAGPVNEQMFFNREEEVKTLTEKISNNNYAILANRKMGKTSLLNRVAPKLKDDLSKQVFYFNLQAVNDYESFYQYLAEEYPEFEKGIAKLNQHPLLAFSQVIKNIKQGNDNRQIILIFDEIDGLLSYDLQRGEQMFKTFRTLSENEDIRVKFIFSGTTKLVEQMINTDSPLYNFCQPLSLGILNKKSAKELVTVPMENLGVNFENEETSVQRILSITARHPNLIQYLCDSLIKKINESQERTITEEDVETVINSKDFYDYSEKLIWGQSKAIDKLLVYLMWSYPQFTESDVKEQFKRRLLDTEGIKNSLDTLQNYTVLSKKNGNGTYYFTFREFVKLMEQRSNIETLIESYQQEVGDSKS